MKQGQATVNKLARLLETAAKKHNESADATCFVAECFELMKCAEKLGVRLEFRSGLNVAVKQTESGDPERQDAILAELVKHIGDVRRSVERRAMAAHANELLGERIWCPEFTMKEGNASEGASASGDGALMISVDNERFRNPQTLTSNAESLLIVLDEEEAEGAASPYNEEPKSAQPRRGIFERLRRGSRED
jgi:hypothetical protein